MTNLSCSTGSVFGIAVTAIPQSNDSATTDGVVGQSNIKTNTSASGWNNYLLYAEEGRAAVFTALIPASCTITGNLIGRLSSDSTIIRCEIEGQRGASILPLDLRLSSSFTYSVFDSYVNGSVAAAITNQISDLLVDGKSLDYFLTVDHSGSGTYMRNPDCWLYDIDLSAVSVASFTGGAWTLQRGGVLLTPRHVEEAAHFPTPVGGKKRFVLANGTVVEKTIIGEAAYSDRRIIVLDSDVAGISPMRLVGDWFAETVTQSPLSQTYYSGGLGFSLNQFKKGHVVKLAKSDVSLSSCASGTAYIGETAISNVREFADVHTGSLLTGFPYLEGRDDFLLDIITYDSGSAVMILDSEGPIYVSHFWYTTSGPYLNEALVNALIVSADADAGVSTGYTVTIAPDPTL